MAFTFGGFCGVPSPPKRMICSSQMEATKSVEVKKGEKPIKADGKLLVIDGGFCRAYQGTTGIAGYTLIYNSHGMNLKTHEPFESVEKVLDENMDIHSHNEQFETEPYRVMIKDTDNGYKIAEKIEDLKALLSCYRQGIISEKR